MLSRFILLLVTAALYLPVRAQETPANQTTAAEAVAAPSAILPSGFFLEDAAPGYTFDTPVGLTFDHEGNIYVVEKRGRVYLIKDGQKLSTPFLDIEAEVLDHWDRGLLGFALDPSFETNGHVYALYTYDRDGSGDYQRQDVAARLTRFTASGVDPEVVDYSTRTVLIGETFATAIPSCYYSHTIGTLQFGTDGTLLVGAGDGADFTRLDPGGLHPDCFAAGLADPIEDIGAYRSQYLGSLAGKILRVDPATGEGMASNPFFTGDATDNQSRVWSLGVRNPYRFTLRTNGSNDPADASPGTLFIGDVGWGTWEDLHVARTGGENYGWPCYEGPSTHSGYQNGSPSHSSCATVSGQSGPDYYWHHGDANLSFPSGLQANAIVVGDIYTSARYPGYNDRIFYADYTRGWVATSAVDTGDNLSDDQVFATEAGAVVDIRHDAVTGYIYWVDVVANKVWRVRHNNENNPPVAEATSDVVDGPAPLTVNFSGSGSTDPDGDTLEYLWDFGDGNSAVGSAVQHTFVVAGVYQVALTVTDENGASSRDFIAIAAGNTFPEASIIDPIDGSIFQIGDYVNLGGTATDTEDSPGEISYEWMVTQRHNAHSHPDFFTIAGPTAGFSVAEHGLADEVNYLEIRLVATDTGGLTDSVRHYVEVARAGESDITQEGTPEASTMSPAGQGSTDIGVVVDGVWPATNESDPDLQYDMYTGGTKTEDWIGITYAGERYFSKLRFQEGIEFSDGGWFDSLTVQVRSAGIWSDVAYLSSIKPYAYDNGVSFETYTLLFEPVWGDGIRVAGRPGGSATFASAAELQVFEMAAAVMQPDVRHGPAPHSVTFADISTVSSPTSWFWDFGDGFTSTEQEPEHTFTAPGEYDVSLTVTGTGGSFNATCPACIVVGESGLLGAYYDDEDFVGSRLLRTDTAIDFDWGSGAPDGTMGSDEFSVRWQGWLTPEFTGSYTFYTVTDDGVRLWIDDQLIIDQWILQAATEWSATFPLEAGRYYPVKMEFYERFGQASAQLLWSSASVTKAIIPTDQLIAASLAPAITTFAPVSGNYLTEVSIYGQHMDEVVAVAFNGTPATTFAVESPGKLVATVPEGATTGPLEVTTVEGVAVSGASFEVEDGSLSAHVGEWGATLTASGIVVRYELVAPAHVDYVEVQHRKPGDVSFSEIGTNRAVANESYYRETIVSRVPGMHGVRLKVVDASGNQSYSDVLDLKRTLDDMFVVSQPYPNPFSETSTIEFATQREQHVSVSLYDILGRRVRILLDTRIQDNELVSVDISRGRLPAGLYFVRIAGESFNTDRKVLVVD